MVLLENLAKAIEEVLIKPMAQSEASGKALTEEALHQVKAEKM